jgi:hypothetical protein
MGLYVKQYVKYTKYTNTIQRYIQLSLFSIIIYFDLPSAHAGQDFFFDSHTTVNCERLDFFFDFD